MGSSDMLSFGIDNSPANSIPEEVSSSVGKYNSKYSKDIFTLRSDFDQTKNGRLYRSLQAMIVSQYKLKRFPNCSSGAQYPQSFNICFASVLLFSQSGTQVKRV